MKKNRKFSMNQTNELWRNIRLTITTVMFPVIGILLVLYETCDPFKTWVNRKLNKIFKNYK